MKRYIFTTLLASFFFTKSFAVVDFSTNSNYIAIKKSYGIQTPKDRYFMIEAEIHILGWSKNNLFAYIIHEANEAKDFEEAKLIIQDIITDNIIASFKWTFKDNNFQDSIKANANKIKSYLRRFKIDSQKFTINPYKHTIVKQMPIKYLGSKIGIKKVIQFKTTGENQFVTNFRLILQKENTKGIYKKTVFKKHYNINDQIFNIYTLGYIASPYSNRVALILAKGTIKNSVSVKVK